MRLALRRDRGCTLGRRADGALMALAAVVATASCETESPAGLPQRETLPNGAVLVRYPSLPAIDSVGPEVSEARVDLRIGTLDGDDPNYIFGDIRGVQASSDGTIYVLDYQAVEIREYSPEGEYLGTIVRRGEGPGEIGEANGILLSGDTLLWIHDHRQWAIIGVDPAGGELRRFTKPVNGYGYIWDGAFDQRGRYWKETYRSDEDEEEYREPEPGLVTSSFRRYYKSYDPSTEAVDSAYLGEGTFRSYMVRRGGGRRFYDIPFEAMNVTTIDPRGGFWHANTAWYGLTRTGEDGDTLVVIEAVVPAYPVTPEDGSDYVQRWVDIDPDARRGAEAVVDLMPEFRPVLEGFFVDDEGKLWVERGTPNDVPPFYDLFSQDGHYQGSVRLAFEPQSSSKVSVQHGNIYTWVVDEFDTPYVVRAPVS